MINIKKFDSDLLKIDKSRPKYWYLLYWYVTMKDFDYVNSHGANSLYFTIDKLDGNIEDNNRKLIKKYLIFASSDKKQRSIDKIYRILNI